MAPEFVKIGEFFISRERIEIDRNSSFFTSLTVVQSSEIVSALLYFGMTTASYTRCQNLN